MWSTKQSVALLCRVYWFIQIVSPVKYSLVLGMDERLASVLGDTSGRHTFGLLPTS